MRARSSREQSASGCEPIASQDGGEAGSYSTVGGVIGKAPRIPRRAGECAAQFDYLCVNVAQLRKVAHGNATHSRSHRTVRSASSCRNSDSSLWL